MATEIQVPTDNTPSVPESQPGGPLVRNVLLYSATRDAPCLTPMEFSTTGSESRRHGGVVAVDLRGRYGQYTADTYLKSFEGESYGEEYLVYFNMNRHLPQNTALSKLLGVDPKRPGKRPMFRGDVAIVTSATMHVLEGLSATYPLRTYMDFPDFKMEFAHDFMRRWYQSAGWADMSFKDEQSDELPPGSIPLDWDWRNPTHIPGFDYDGEDEKERQQKKASKRLVTADNKRQERYERFASRRCAYCGITELPPRSKCSRCLSAHYCSPECQKAHWKDHKEDCRSAGIGAQR